MLIDIMSPYSYLQVNTKMISVFGLNVAAYWAELLNIYPRVIKKKKDEVIQANGFFTIDRDYIKSRTSLDLAEQAKCDKALVNVGALAVSEENPNFICISLNRMFEILSEDDSAVLLSVQKQAKSKKANSAETKALMIRANLKKAVICSDTDLTTAYYTWVDAIMDSKNVLTKAALEIFVRTVENYSTSKLVKLKIIEIATVHSYRDAQWAINMYERDSKKSGTFIGVPQKQNVGIDPNSIF
jgi:hypothetical protein